MKRRYWRFSRPAGCFLCLCVLLFMAWLIRLFCGPPPAGAAEQVKRLERRCLRPPGALVEVYREGDYYPVAVTEREGELYTYYLFDKGPGSEGKPGYTDGSVWRDTVHDLPWGCCIGPFYQYEVNKGNAVWRMWTYVLVKNTDPAVTGATITATTRIGDGNGARSRKWTAEAVRRNPYYLAFRLELFGGSELARRQFSAIVNGLAAEDTEAGAEVVFYDADGNERSRLQFDMLKKPTEEERSEDHGA